MRTTPVSDSADSADSAPPGVVDVIAALRFHGLDPLTEASSDGSRTTIRLRGVPHWVFEVHPEAGGNLGRWTAIPAYAAPPDRDIPAESPLDQLPPDASPNDVARAIIVTVYRRDDCRDFDTIRQRFLGPDYTEHLALCKARALEYVDAGLPHLALTSMVNDIRKHPATADGHPVDMLAIMLAATGHLDTADEVRRFIEGYH